MHTVRTLAFGVFLLILSPATALAEPAHGVLRVVKGEVQIQSAGSSALSRARLGMQVAAHDVIVTGKEGRAKIVMNDGNELNISPDSRIEIQNYEYDPGAGKKDVLLNVIYGKVRAKVEQHYDGKTSHFQVKTAAAVAGVRGTDFITSFEPKSQSSSVTTFRGAVDFGLPGPNGAILNAVSVTPGMSASSIAGKAPAPAVTIPKDQLKKIDSDSHSDAGNSAAANPPTTKQKDGGRSLANVNPAGMMLPQDLPASGGELPSAVTTNSPAAAPKAPVIPQAPQCTTCNAVIQHKGSGNINVHIK